LLPDCGESRNLGKIDPQGLKPSFVFEAFTARLKPCPFKSSLQRGFFSELWSRALSKQDFYRKLIRNKNASSTKRDVVMKFYRLPPIGQKQRRPMDGAQFHSPRVGEAGGGLKRNKNASSTKYDVVTEFYGLPPIGQKQRRPMDGAQFHRSRVGFAGGRLLPDVMS
jgi:hypothetical protein